LNSPNFTIGLENALGYLHQNWGVLMPLLFGAEVSYEEMSMDEKWVLMDCG
jgi:hypothetical protein